MKRIKPEADSTWHYEGLGEGPKRKLVCPLYLNDIPNAGETEFLYLYQTYKCPKKVEC